MIDKLSIKNFKSIKTLSTDCKIIILFKGERISGSSRTLEALCPLCLTNCQGW